MIVWVDEEERTTYPSRLLLAKKGYAIAPVANATDGYEKIVQQMRNELNFAIIDVMLLQGEDLTTFSDKETREGVITGLVLIDKLLKEYHDYTWTEKIVVFSRASDEEIVAKITNFCEKKGLRYVKKDNSFRATEFIKWLEDEGLIE